MLYVGNFDKNSKLSQPEFIIISDNTSFGIIGVRYIGPYRLAHELENHNIKTYVLDRMYSHPDFFQLLELVVNENTIGIGISSTFMTPPQERTAIDADSDRQMQVSSYYQYPMIDRDFKTTQKWFKELKRILVSKSPNGKIFLGGAKAHLFCNFPHSQISEIDYICMGPADNIISKVLSDLNDNDGIKFSKLNDKKIIDTKVTYKQQKNCPRHEWKAHWSVMPNEALPIEISRGCSFNCKFCNYDKQESSLKNLANLKEELIRNYECFGTQSYHILDDCFNDSRKKVESVCEVFLSLPFSIEWITYARFDVAVKFPETADMMVAAGARGLFWGAESFTYEVARRAGKGTPTDAIKDFLLKFYRRYEDKCFSTGSFICGLPGETEETWKEQMDWLIANKAFHFLQIGPLAVRPYKTEFDGTLLDYADYSRNPQKYGFVEIDCDQQTWKHQTMDSTTAQRLSSESMRMWNGSRPYKHSLTKDVWIYPALRSLGLNQEQIYKCYFSNSAEETRDLNELVVKRGVERVRNYFTNLHNYFEYKNRQKKFSDLRV